MLWKMLPNALTVLRLLAGLVFPFVDEFWWLPLVVFAGLTDLIDGWLSRMWNGTSTFGQLLDPVADKTFVLAVLWSVWQHGWVSLLELAWLAARDLTVLGLTIFAAASTRLTAQDLRPRWPGKCATAAQFVVLTIIVYRRSAYAEGILWGGIVSAFAAIDYTLTARRAWLSRPPGK